MAARDRGRRSRRSRRCAEAGIALHRSSRRTRPRACAPHRRADWHDVSGGAHRSRRAPYRVPLAARAGPIAVFFYDGPISRAVAFEGAAASRRALRRPAASAASGERATRPQLVHIATDGETYGHHHRHGDMALAYALDASRPTALAAAHELRRVPRHAPADARGRDRRETRRGAAPTASGAGAATAAATPAAQRAGTRRGARRCARRSTGCATTLRRASRARGARAASAIRGRRATTTSTSSSTARAAASTPFLATPRRAPARRRAERSARSSCSRCSATRMLMYTSCGWFFDDISGIETVQVLQYAGANLDFMDELGLEPPRERFLEVLAEAKSNVARGRHRRRHHAKRGRPVAGHPARIAAHLAISSLVEEGDDSGTAGGYHFRRSRFQKRDTAGFGSPPPSSTSSETITGRRHDYAVGSMHLGGVDFYCAVKPYPGKEAFEAVAADVWSAFRTASLPVMLRILQQELGPTEGGMESVLPDGRERISELVFGNIVGNFVDEYGRLYESHQRVLEQLQEAGFELPKELRTAAEFALGRRFMQEIKNAQRSLDPAAYRKAIEIADEALRRGYEIDCSAAASHILGEMIAAAVTRATESPIPPRLKTASSLVELARRLRADAHLFQRRRSFTKPWTSARTGPMESRPWPSRSASLPPS